MFQNVYMGRVSTVELSPTEETDFMSGEVVSDSLRVNRPEVLLKFEVRREIND